MTQPSQEQLDRLRDMGRAASGYATLRTLLADLEKMCTAGDAIHRQHMHLNYHQCDDTRILGPRVGLSDEAAKKIHEILIADVRSRMLRIGGEIYDAC